MASLASINIKFTADLRGFSSEMQNSLRQIEKAGQQFQKIGRSMSAFVTLPILAAGAAAVKFASDYNESLNKVDVAFKGSSQQVKEFAKTSLESFGIAEGSALESASLFGDMATGMGLPVAAAAKMSTSLVGLAADLSSFKNIGIEQANTALAAIFTGETESLKKLGIIMTEVNLKQFALNSGITKTYETMSQAEKVNLRYNYVLSQTKNAQGDFTRTSGGAANQTRIFTESLKQVGQQLGAVILPLFTKVITAINEKIKAFSKLSEGTKTVIVVVAGLVAVIGPLLLGIGALLSAIPFIVAGFALISASILPILAGVVLLGGALLVLKNAFSETTKASVQLNDSQKLTQKVTDEATASIVDQKSVLESLLITARNENETKANRLKAIQAINNISPQYLGNLTLENINTDKARVSVEKYNAALIAGATARAASRLLEQNQTDKIKAGFEREKALADYNAKRETAIAKGWEAEKAFYEENNRLLQFANEALDRKNAKYDSESKLLTEIYNKNKDNLKLVASTAPVADVVAPAKVKKAAALKAPANLESVNALAPVNFKGTINSYNAQITDLENFKNEVALTSGEVKKANEDIGKIEFAKNLKFDPTSLIAISGGFDKLQLDIQAKAGGIAASLDAISLAGQQLRDNIANAALPALTDAFASMGDGIVASLGLANTGFQGFIGGLLQTVTKLIAMMLAASISQSIAGASASGAATGPAAIFTTPAFIATAVGGVLAAFAAIPKFETGGVIGGSSFYGDKILARVNSAEMISNTDQQKRIWGAMNSGGDSGGFVASTKLVGPDLLIWIERAQARKNRLG